MAVGLDPTRQDDFAAGAVRSSARHLISSRGTYDVLNGLHDDDGSIYRRGGNALHSAVGAAPRWVWDGVLGPALQRTVLATSAVFEVLDSDDSTRISLGGAGLAAPVKPAVIDGIMFIPGGTLYAGSRETADYSTGTVSGTAGLKVLTGVGTTWVGNVDPGMLIRIGAAGRYYVVASVDSNTQITLMQPLLTTPAGATYAATRLGTAGPHTAGLPASGAVLPLVAAHENRLVVAAGDTIYFSNGVDPTTGALRTQTFTATDFHRVPSGVAIVALESLRERLLVFTSSGLYAITNMAFNLVDGEGNVQQRLEVVSEDVVAWGATGICGYKGALVVPATDGIYLIDGLGQPLPLSDSMVPALRAALTAGKRPGGAVVFNGHLLLPVVAVDGVTVEESWALRVDRPVQTSRGLVFAFSRLTGGGAPRCFAHRHVAGSAPLLLAADPVDLAVTDCSAFFAPSADAREDDRGSFRWMVETRDYWTGDGRQENVVIRFRASYELVDSTGVARLSASVGAGALPDDASAKWGAVLWGSFVWGSASADDFVQMAGSAPPADVRTPYTWPARRRARVVRFRVETEDACDSLVLRAVEFETRRSGRPSR
jgi:hypothetical protein